MHAYVTSLGLTRIVSVKNREVFMNHLNVRRQRDLKLTYFFHWLLLLTLLFIGCQRASANRSSGVPDALLVVSGASDVQFSTRYGTQQVNYQVKKICYPGKKVIDELSNGMLQRKWVILSEDIMNPGLKANAARDEWSTFWDAQGNYIYQWIDDWKDPAGNIIRYGLRYIAKDKKNPIKNCNMEVYGIFFTKQSFDETMSHLPSDDK